MEKAICQFTNFGDKLIIKKNMNKNIDTKEKKRNAHKLVCLSQLLLECLDDLKVTNPKMINIKNNLTQFCEELNNNIADTQAILKTTYFNDINNKIDTVIRKNFNENF